MSDVLPQPGDQKQESTGAPRHAPRHTMRVLGVLLITISLLSGLYLLVGYLGWQSGQAQMRERQDTQQAEQITRQVSLAEENIAQGSYNLALRRLEWVLTRVPEHPQALMLRETAQTLLNITPTPQTAVTPTPIPLPSPTPGLIVDPLVELQRVHLLLAKEQWPDAITAILSFQRQFPDHERQETNKLLYDSNLALGMTLIDSEQAELGLFYLNQAEALGNLPQEAEDYRLWAEWYLQGIGFYGVNWPIAIGYFRDLCLVAPFYQSSCQLLTQSLIAYADLYAFAQDWCPAVDFYVEAQRQGNSVALGQKIEAARAGCLAATPTPAFITDTLPITGTQPISGTSPFFLPTPPFGNNQ